MSMRKVESAHEIRTILTDPAWRVRPAGNEVPEGLRASLAGDIFASFARMTDGDDHPRRKRIVIEQIDKLNLANIPAVTSGIVSRLDHVSPHNVQFLLPGMVIAHLLGVPKSEQRPLVEHVRALVIGARATATTEESCTSVAAMKHAVPMMASVLHADERDDLEAIASCLSMLFQASDAGAALIGNALVALASTPDLSDVDGESIVRNSMRARTPVRTTTRVQHGETVVLDLESAHRQHPDAEWTFGFGPHACPARVLAVEIAAACINEVVIQRPFDPHRVRVTGRENLPNVWIPILSIEN